jgi:hypothetical protein
LGLGNFKPSRAYDRERACVPEIQNPGSISTTIFNSSSGGGESSTYGYPKEVTDAGSQLGPDTAARLKLISLIARTAIDLAQS